MSAGYKTETLNELVELVYQKERIEIRIARGDYTRLRYGPERTRRWGLSPEALLERTKRLIAVELDAQGVTVRPPKGAALSDIRAWDKAQAKSS